MPAAPVVPAAPDTVSVWPLLMVIIGFTVRVSPVTAVDAVTVGWLVGLPTENSAVSAAPGAPPVQFVPVDHVEFVVPDQVTLAACAPAGPKIKQTASNNRLETNSRVLSEHGRIFFIGRGRENVKLIGTRLGGVETMMCVRGFTV